MKPLLTVIITTHTITDKDQKLASRTMAKVQKLLRPLIKNGDIELKVTEEVSDFENA
jgi:hypothetical protein